MYARGRLDEPALVEFIRRSFDDTRILEVNAATHSSMLHIKVGLWYAEDVTRRIKEAIDSGCQGPIDQSREEDDPCASSPPHSLSINVE